MELEICLASLSKLDMPKKIMLINLYIKLLAVPELKSAWWSKKVVNMESGPKKKTFCKIIYRQKSSNKDEKKLTSMKKCLVSKIETRISGRYPRWSSEIIAIFFYNQIWQYILTIFRYCIYVEFLRKSIEWCVFERVNYYTAVVVCAQNWQIWRLESGWKKIALTSSSKVSSIAKRI